MSTQNITRLALVLGFACLGLGGNAFAQGAAGSGSAASGTGGTSPSPNNTAGTPASSAQGKAMTAPTSPTSGVSAMNPSRSPSTTANAGGSSSPVAASDRKFMMDANMAGLTEVQAGKLAQQKGTSEDVKSFGSRMVEDHTKAGDQLKSIAARKNFELPASLDKKHEGAIDKLAKSKNFDKDFASMMVKDHKEAVSLFEKESKSKDADLSGFAGSTLPTLQDHLKMAQGLGKSGGTPKK